MNSQNESGRFFSETPVSRRKFLGTSVLGALGVSSASVLPSPNAQVGLSNPLPRWRGFNLINFFQAFASDEQGQGLVREDDLRWMRDWGFDFVRLPMDYWLWIDSNWRQTRQLTPDDVFRIKESELAKVDRTVELCRRYGLHLSLNFHRAPGYCINNPDREPFVLWSDPRAADAFVYHWEAFARRYRDEPKGGLSFNLLNEAPTPRDGYMTREDYVRVMTRAIKAIRAHAPEHAILIDGLSVGNEVVTEMIPSGAAQSVHAYWPAGISHYRARWVDKNLSFPEPTWPWKNREGKVTANRAGLEERFAPWGELVGRGVGVHCGECGCFNKTPHEVFLAWFTDVMEILQNHGIGYALWNFRGSFGILDSGRSDVAYEDWHGHKLDRRLLDLLRRF